jgi:hypothetical protein
METGIAVGWVLSSLVEPAYTKCEHCGKIVHCGKVPFQKMLIQQIKKQETAKKLKKLRMWHPKY